MVALALSERTCGVLPGRSDQPNLGTPTAKLFGRMTGHSPSRLLNYSGEQRCFEGASCAFVIVRCLEAGAVSEPTRGELQELSNWLGFSVNAHGAVLPDGSTVMLIDPAQQEAIG